jgi:O-antigen ligase
MNLARIYYPAFFSILIISAFSYVDFSVTALLLVVSGVILCRSVFAGNEWRNYTLTSLMLAYLVWLFVVALSSAIPNASMATLAILAGLPVMYLFASNLSSYDQIWKTLRIVFFVLAVILASWAIWQVFNNIGYGQAVGPLLDRNAFAALMNLLWFPSAYLLISSVKNSKRVFSAFSVMGLFIISIALFATASRGGIATWLLLVPVFLWASYKYTNSSLLVLIVPIIALTAYFCSSQLLHSNVAERTFQIVQHGSVQDGSTNARLQVWQSTIKMALDHPIVGTGWGTFGNIYPAYRLPIENTTSGFLAHNDYLQFAAEGGFPALCLLLGILIALLFLLKRSLNHAACQTGIESIALILGVLALFIQAVVNFIFYYAFISIIAGFYLARAAQLTDKFQVIQVQSFQKIRPLVKRLLAGTIITIISIPFVMHLISTIFLTGSQLGLKSVNVLAPKVSAFDVARLITAVRPAESLAQEYMMQTYEYYLMSDSSSMENGVIDKRRLLTEAIERFDSVRKLEANNPSVGTREVKILMAHHSTYGTNYAHEKIRQILNANLKADPYHANSMIALSRLQVAEGNKSEALNTLQFAVQHILTRRDEQLIIVEMLRQLAAPKVIHELDEIENQLHQIRSDAETGKASTGDASFYDNIDIRLNAISKQAK